jgi:hypothetical protein
MFLQKINKNDPDRVYTVIHNNEGSAIARGACVELDMDGDAGVTVGVSVEECDAADAASAIGIAAGKTFTGGSIPDDAFGLAQVYGHMLGVVSTASVAADTALQANAAGGVMAVVAGVSDNRIGFSTAAESGGTIAMFIQAM